MATSPDGSLPAGATALWRGASGRATKPAMAPGGEGGRGSRFVAVRFWQGNETVYGSAGKAEAAYRPDPSGRTTLLDLAAALGGRSFEGAGGGGGAAVPPRPPRGGRGARRSG